MHELDHSAYDKMLKIQTDIFYPFENCFFKNLALNNLKKIGEVGCGNAAFLSRVAQHFPQPHYFGVDINPIMVSFFKQQDPSTNINISAGTVDDLESNLNLVILRLLAHQLTERKSFFTILKQKLLHQGYLVIIDANDEHFLVEPGLPKTFERIKKQREEFSKNHAVRNLKKILPTELGNLGFKMIYESDYCVSSLVSDYKDPLLKYLNIFNQMYFSDEVDIFEEIKNWGENPNSYMQLGLFIQVYQLG